MQLSGALMMSRLRTSTIVRPKLSERPSVSTQPIRNDPVSTAAQDHPIDHAATMPEPTLDLHALYVGCPSRLKLLGLWLDAKPYAETSSCES
jgi:hypothetical protein